MTDPLSDPVRLRVEHSPAKKYPWRVLVLRSGNWRFLDAHKTEALAQAQVERLSPKIGALEAQNDGHLD